MDIKAEFSQLANDQLKPRPSELDQHYFILFEIYIKISMMSMGFDMVCATVVYSELWL